MISILFDLGFDSLILIRPMAGSLNSDGFFFHVHGL